MTDNNQPLILLTGGTGTTGRRIAERLAPHVAAVRIASRGGTPPFDWARPDTWPAVLEGVTAAYIAYSPDLAMPGAVDTVDRFCRAARRSGVEQFVLLAGRGEAEAEAAEQVVRESGARSTIIRASWFAQNFSEGMLRQAVLDGVIALPAGDVQEPFVDVEDIADVAAAALLDPVHDGRTYDVTGPRAITFAEAAALLSVAAGRPIEYLDVSRHDFVVGAVVSGVPEPIATALATVFESVLDGRNAHLGEGVLQALGRPPRAFEEFAIGAATEGAWDVSPASVTP